MKYKPVGQRKCKPVREVIGYLVHMRVVHVASQAARVVEEGVAAAEGGADVELVEVLVADVLVQLPDLQPPVVDGEGTVAALEDLGQNPE